MKASFQILTQPWIPVKELDGSMKELSLLETLERAHLLSEIQDPSPMVEYSVYRFLIVFLMDMLRPEDEEVLEELLDEGQFDWDTIQRYVRQCEQEGVSFDLFDSERPFLQTRYRADWDRDPKPVSTLDYSIPNGQPHPFRSQAGEDHLHARQSAADDVGCADFLYRRGAGVSL